MRKGVLLINLGTPQNADTASVRKYLHEFLHDPRVIDIPPLQRLLLVNLLILPLRIKKSAKAYQKIWMEEGSPLLVFSERFKKALSKHLGHEYHVELGMRYGTPDITTALQKLKHCDQLTVLPLFPQYTAAATGSAMQKFIMRIASEWNLPAITIQNDFYADAGFIAAYVEVIKTAIQHQSIDKLVFSYHGLPERHIKKSECQAVCDHLHACPAIQDNNRFCYRAQCYATTEAIAKELNLPADKYVVSFQSRLGRTPWIKPYTDLLLPELRQQGVKNIAVVCPSFVADCLETLEEVNIRLREQWQKLGGHEFIFIPCLNDHPLWVKAVAAMVQ